MDRKKTLKEALKASGLASAFAAGVMLNDSPLLLAGACSQCDKCCLSCIIAAILI